MPFRDFPSYQYLPTFCPKDPVDLIAEALCDPSTIPNNRQEGAVLTRYIGHTGRILTERLFEAQARLQSDRRKWDLTFDGVTLLLEHTDITPAPATSDSSGQNTTSSTSIILNPFTDTLTLSRESRADTDTEPESWLNVTLPLGHLANELVLSHPDDWNAFAPRCAFQLPNELQTTTILPFTVIEHPDSANLNPIDKLQVYYRSAATLVGVLAAHSCQPPRPKGYVIHYHKNY